MTILSVSYAQLGSLALSSREPNGVEWRLTAVDGWGSPAVTLSSQQRPRSHGAWSGDSYLAARTVVLTGVVIVEDPTTLSDAMDRLIAAADLDPFTLTMVEAGRSRTSVVRRMDEVLFTDMGAYAAGWSVHVAADDPRKYGPALSLATALPSSSGGLTLPMVLPYIFASTTVSGVVSLTNEGNISSPLTVRFDGPVTGPKIIHIQTQKTWAAGGAVLGAGEFWTVSMDSRQVLAQGQASRSGFVTERGWMELLPGPNDFAFSADSYNAASQMTVTAASAWK